MISFWAGPPNAVAMWAAIRHRTAVGGRRSGRPCYVSLSSPSNFCIGRPCQWSIKHQPRTSRCAFGLREQQGHDRGPASVRSQPRQSVCQRGHTPVRCAPSQGDLSARVELEGVKDRGRLLDQAVEPRALSNDGVAAFGFEPFRPCSYGQIVRFVGNVQRAQSHHYPPCDYGKKPNF